MTVIFPSIFQGFGSFCWFLLFLLRFFHPRGPVNTALSYVFLYRALFRAFEAERPRRGRCWPCPCADWLGVLYWPKRLQSAENLKKAQESLGQTQ